MRKQVKVWSVLLLMVMLSSYAVALEKPALQQAQAGTSTQLVISGPDVITASDAGGGFLSTRDILLVLLIVLAVIGLIVLL